MENEILLENGLIDTNITNGASDEEMAGSVEVSEKGVFKAFQNHMYNQLDVDPYSCTLVSAFTALANAKDKKAPVNIVQEAFKDYVASGKFKAGYGWSLADGAYYATKHFNEWAGTAVKVELVPFTMQNVIASLKMGFPCVSGIKYGPAYFKNEQDDGIIQSGEWVTGNNGHAIAFVKANTVDDQLIKFVENYDGVLKFQIIYTDFQKNRDLFFQSMVRFYE